MLAKMESCCKKFLHPCYMMDKFSACRTISAYSLGHTVHACKIMLEINSSYYMLQEIHLSNILQERFMLWHLYIVAKSFSIMPHAIQTAINTDCFLSIHLPGFRRFVFLYWVVFVCKHVLYVAYE